MQKEQPTAHTSTKENDLRRILEFSLLVGLMLFNSVIYINGQERQRIVQDLYLPKDAPIQIIGRELEGRKFEDSKLDNRISGRANSDWIKHLTLVVKNASKKNISYVEITLMVPQQKQMPGPMIYYVMFGSRDGTGINGLISPGGQAKIKVRDSEYLAWEKRLMDWGVDDFDQVLLVLRAVYFDDGTGWSSGLPLVQDPRNPKRWLHADKPLPYINSLVSLFGDLLSPIRQDAGFFLQSRPESQRFCGWGLVARNPRECQGCTDPVDTAACDQFFDDTFYLVPTGSAPEGFVIEDVPQNCNSTSPGTSNCGSCPGSGFTSDVFTPFSNCGQPQTCGNSSYWGCVSGLVDVNGICQKSQAFQNACPAPGYDSLACACKPTPTPTPSPTPRPTPEPTVNCEPPYGGNNYCPVGTSFDASTGLCCPGGCPNPPPTYSCNVMMSEQLEGEVCPYYIERPCGATPIVVDVAGNGFNLTDVENGVNFYLYNNPDGRRERFSWTAQNSDDAWLVFDRNGNGTIDSGRELFGNFTPQSAPPSGELKNGFLALAEYDKPAQGGNSDSVIDARDSIFNSLRLWQDINHNGVSEQSELHPLTALGLAELDLDYRDSRRRDRHGNLFKYRAKVRDERGAQLGRWAWDVFLVKQP